MRLNQLIEALKIADVELEEIIGDSFTEHIEWRALEIYNAYVSLNKHFYTEFMEK